MLQRTIFPLTGHLVWQNPSLHFRLLVKSLLGKPRRDCSNPPSPRIMCVQKARLKIWGCVSRGRIFNLKEELRLQWDFCSLCVRLAVFTNCCYIRIMYKIHYVQSSTTKISVIWSHCKLNVCAGQDRTKYSSIINLCTLLHTSSKKL